MENIQNIRELQKLAKDLAKQCTVIKKHGCNPVTRRQTNNIMEQLAKMITTIQKEDGTKTITYFSGMVEDTDVGMKITTYSTEKLDTRSEFLLKPCYDEKYDIKMSKEVDQLNSSTIFGEISLLYPFELKFKVPEKYSTSTQKEYSISSKEICQIIKTRGNVNEDICCKCLKINETMYYRVILKKPSIPNNMLQHLEISVGL
jgi:hypothetical protein